MTRFATLTLIGTSYICKIAAVGVILFAVGEAINFGSMLIQARNEDG